MKLNNTNKNKSMLLLSVLAVTHPCYTADITEGAAPSAGASGGATEVDPLSEVASGIEERKFPCLAPDRIGKFKINKVTHGPTKSDPTKNTLAIEVVTTEDMPDTDGKTLRAGYKGYIYIGTTPTEERKDESTGRTINARTIQDIKADLAMPLKATGKGNYTLRDLLNNPAMLEGEVVDLKIGYRKEANGFSAQNTFKWVLPG